MVNIQVLLTVFNRRAKTLEALTHLYSNRSQDVRISVTLLDDGSKDGTAEAIAAQFPEVNIIIGDGSHYWNGGMRKAWEIAALSDPDFYLWLNDDTLLDTSAVQKLLHTSAFFADQAIVVGSTRDPETGEATYGGVIKESSWKPLRFRNVAPSPVVVAVDTMNGNCVLISKAVKNKVGLLSSAYTHGMGDFDYGLRAKKLGIEIWLVPEYVGTCSRNTVSGTWQSTALSTRLRWQKLKSVKGLPPREWLTFTRRHGGSLWLLTFLSPYLRVLLTTKKRKA
ncbi:glycosyltransferase family 2 protein [Deinococcus oregonensis]|uniref:Glycosyltransferase family 2 protein n=1 Tax=Deinococcus oregonensis TaxID=1805970 RepID=A0ABV6B5I7_9DEIO